MGWPVDREDIAHDDARLQRGIDRLRRLRGELTDPLLIGCVIALENATGLLKQRPNGPLVTPRQSPDRPGGKRRVNPKIALRQTAGVVWVYYTAMAFGLGYPYWASMAVIVVLQGGARITWTRGLERIIGSLLGGSVALILLNATHNEAILSLVGIMLAAVAIALRSVNYTVFVVFLTMLFIIVTEMLQPGTGIASARILDNAVGSIAAMAGSVRDLARNRAHPAGTDRKGPGREPGLFRCSPLAGKCREDPGGPPRRPGWPASTPRWPCRGSSACRAIGTGGPMTTPPR